MRLEPLQPSVFIILLGCVCLLTACGTSSGPGDAGHRIDDHFRMLCTRGGYHCWYAACLMVFDQPLDTISGLLVEGDEFGQLGNQIKYLNANLEVAETRTILSWQ